MKANMPSPHVMVVDDEPSVRHIVRRMLQSFGYIVEEAPDPKTACDMIANMESLDLLITDFHMPEVTGEEVARRVRAAKPDLKVLFITGFADDLFDRRGVLWQGEAFLEKPFSQQSLLEAASLLLFGRISQAVS